MQNATNTEKQQFFITVEKVEAIAGNMAAWSQTSNKKTPSKQYTLQPS